MAASSDTTDTTAHESDNKVSSWIDSNNASLIELRLSLRKAIDSNNHDELRSLLLQQQNEGDISDDMRRLVLLKRAVDDGLLPIHDACRRAVVSATTLEIIFDAALRCGVLKEMIEATVTKTEWKKSSSSNAVANVGFVRASVEKNLEALELLIAHFPTKESFSAALHAKNESQSVIHLASSESDTEEIRSFLADPECWTKCRSIHHRKITQKMWKELSRLLFINDLVNIESLLLRNTDIETCRELLLLHGGDDGCLAIHDALRYERCDQETTAFIVNVAVEFGIAKQMLEAATAAPVDDDGNIYSEGSNSIVMFVLGLADPSFTRLHFVLDACSRYADLGKILRHRNSRGLTCLHLAVSPLLEMDSLKLLIGYFPSKETFCSLLLDEADHPREPEPVLERAHHYIDPSYSYKKGNADSDEDDEEEEEDDDDEDDDEADQEFEELRSFLLDEDCWNDCFTWRQRFTCELMQQHRSLTVAISDNKNDSARQVDMLNQLLLNSANAKELLLLKGFKNRTLLLSACCNDNLSGESMSVILSTIEKYNNINVITQVLQAADSDGDNIVLLAVKERLPFEPLFTLLQFCRTHLDESEMNKLVSRENSLGESFLRARDLCCNPENIRLITAHFSSFEVFSSIVRDYLDICDEDEEEDDDDGDEDEDGDVDWETVCSNDNDPDDDDDDDIESALNIDPFSFWKSCQEWLTTFDWNLYESRKHFTQLLEANDVQAIEEILDTDGKMEQTKKLLLTKLAGHIPILDACWKKVEPAIMANILDAGVRCGIIRAMLEDHWKDKGNAVAMAMANQLPLDTLHVLLQYCNRYTNIIKILENGDNDELTCFSFAAQFCSDMDCLRLLVSYFPSHESFYRTVGRKDKHQEYCTLKIVQYAPPNEFRMPNVEFLHDKACWQKSRRWLSDFDPPVYQLTLLSACTSPSEVVSNEVFDKWHELLLLQEEEARIEIQIAIHDYIEVLFNSYRYEYRYFYYGTATTIGDDEVALTVEDDEGGEDRRTSTSAAEARSFIVSRRSSDIRRKNAIKQRARRILADDDDDDDGDSSTNDEDF